MSAPPTIEEAKPKTERSAAGELLRDFWYHVLPSHAVKRGQMKRQILLNIPLLVGRDKHGQPFVMDDHCPHRGIPLSYGSFDGERVECCYHGWQFDCEGRCQYIPALTPDSRIKVDKIRAKSFPSAEADGYIWVFLPSTTQRQQQELPPVPRLAVFSEKYQQHSFSRRLGCSIDHGIVGLMDPAHGPFVHQSFWWRSRHSIHTKSKVFEPIPHGFRMSTHTPSRNSGPYKLLNLYGEPITTTIDFILPNIRLEQVRCGPYWFSSQTVVTPITNEECRLDISAAWNIFRQVPLVKLAYRVFSHLFVKQDQVMMEKQADGLKDNPPLMLIDDADTQAKWYYRLKAAYLEAQRTGQPLEHPLKGPVTLTWRS